MTRLRNLFFAAALCFAAALPPAAGAVDHLFQGWDDVNAARIENPETGKGGKNLEYLGPMLRRAFYSTAASSGLYTVADRTALAAITKATLSATTALPGVTELVVRVTSDADSKPRRYRWKAADATSTSDYILATSEGGTGRWFAIIDDTTDAASVGLLDADFAGTYAGALIRTGSAAYAVLKHNLAAGAAPAGTDDGPTNGYAIGSLWIDTTSSPRALYMAVDVTDDTAVWRKLSDGTELRHAAFAGSAKGTLLRTGSATYAVLKDNYAGGAAPVATDDGPDGGYAVGSLWIDTTSSPRALYQAVDVTDNTAVWRLLADGTELRTGSYAGTHTGTVVRTGATTFAVRRNNSTGSNPTVNDDSTGSYNVGSRWTNTTTKEAFELVDASVAAAIWRTAVPIRKRTGRAPAADQITNNSAKTAFATTGLDIPANAPVGTRIRGTAVFEVAEAEADEELVVSIEAGGTVFAASASAVRAAGVEIYIVWDLVVTATGASGRLAGQTNVFISGSSPASSIAYELAIDLSATRTITAYGDNETASAGNDVDLMTLDSECWSL